MMPLPNLLLVVSGPSGAGKSTLCDRFTDASPETEMVVTTTTRRRRSNETDGIDYHFLGREEFEQRIAREEFLEYAEVHGNFYGSPIADVKRLMAAGKDVILEIDVQGGLNVRKKFPEVLLIYVTPSDLTALRRRLSGRGTESEADIRRRISNARNELATLPEYDYLVINDQLDQAVDRLRAIVRSEKQRIERYERQSLLDSLIKGAEGLQ
ncbi:MAG: guanylate kinase [Candidatus Wallbacteria bacterium]|nr:guanylate kinase [Candidatus Wallbacteria bacterium]